MRSRFEVRREQFSLQAHFASPEFDLFKDTTGLARYLFEKLGPHGIRLTDLKLESLGESLGEVNLRVLSWSEYDIVRLFLDRLEVAWTNLGEGHLIVDLLNAITGYSPAVNFKAFAVTQELHGTLDSPPKDFLGRFSTAAPKKFGSLAGSGTVFYYGSSEGVLAGTIILDFSRLVEGGIFLRITSIYDASRVEPADLLTVARQDLSDIFNEIGLDMEGD